MPGTSRERDPRVVLVLGMHRTGTSAMARGLRCLGMQVGDDLNPATDDNPRGFWEDRGVWALDQRLLAAFDATWDSQLVIDPERLETPALAVLEAEARELVRARLASLGGRWAVKDPRMCRLLPFWKRVLAAEGIVPDVVLTTRNPLSVADSLRRRDGFSPEKSFLLWLAHTVAALADTSGLRRVVVEYDRLVDDPRGQIARVGAALSLEVVPGGGESGLEGYADDFVEPGLRHHTTAASPTLEHPGVPDLLQETWSLMREAAGEGISPGDPRFQEAVEGIGSALAGLAPFIRHIHATERDLLRSRGELAAGARRERAERERREREERERREREERERREREERERRERHEREERLRRERDLALARVREETAALGQRLEVVVAELRARNDLVAELRSSLQEEQRRAHENVRARDQLQELLASRSWRVTAPLRIADRAVRGRSAFGALRTLAQAPTLATIRFRGMFDARGYRRANPDLTLFRWLPFLHWVLRGAAEGRNPNDWFDVAWYLEQYPDVRSSRLNPLVHYVRHGAGESRQTQSARRASTEGIPHEGAPGQGQPASGCRSLAGADGEAAEGRAARHRSGAAARRRAAARPRALVIDSRWPQPDRDAGSLEAMNLLQALLGSGYRVHCAATAEDPREAPYRVGLEGLGVDCLEAGVPSIRSFLRRNGEDLDLCVLVRVAAGGAFFESVRRHAGPARVLFNTIDLHHLREKREALLTGDMKALTSAAATQERERYLVRQADATIVVSEAERDLLLRKVPGARVVVLPLGRETRTSVPAFDGRTGAGFIGGFAHVPNRDAVHYFLREVWPIVAREMPECEFSIVGSGLPDDIARGLPSGVRYLGHLPEIEPWFDRLRLSVAPLRYGAGAKGKVASSLANGVPCVLTPVAAEGMGIEDGREAIVAESPESLAAGIVRLHRSRELWERLSAGAIAYSRRELSVEAWRRTFGALLQEIGLPARGKEKGA